MLREAIELYELGFGVHWIKPKSKAPVKGGWNGPKRDDIMLLRREYKKGYGLGVRLGEPSKIMVDGKAGYLAVVDIDLRSGDVKHRKEVAALVNKLFPGLLKKNPPKVATGRGNGSGHIYVLTEKPLPSKKLGASSEMVEVFSPTSKISTQQRNSLCQEKLDRGIRVKPAWEVDLMSVGKQVVLPPTLHPDTGQPYRWVTEIIDVSDIPFLKAKNLNSETFPNGFRGEGSGRPNGSATFKFDPVSVDLVDSDLSSRIVDMIMSGDGVEDRSAALMSASLAMVKAGFTDNEILSVLTDRDNFLGEVAYEHRRTSSRKNAAHWVYEHTLRKAKSELDAKNVFDQEVEVTTLNDEDAEKQHQALTVEMQGEEAWQNGLSRTQPRNGVEGAIKPTLRNVVLILRNAVSQKLFVHDAFEDRTCFGVNAPWGNKKGDMVTDAAAIELKHWLATEFRCEPSMTIVYEAITVIAHGNSFHPVREAIEALPQWDGVARLDGWLKDYLGADAPEPYLSDVSRKFLLGAIARIYTPGIKLDHMLILEGAQGIGKSSVGRILAGQKWFQDGLPELANKDAALSLVGRWFVEMSELANFKRGEVEVIKGFITREVDKVRPPYGRNVVEYKRQCVFFGTTNDSFYLKDQTGNRRFWPVRVTRKLNFEQLATDRDQLLAEALWTYQNLPEPLYLEDEALEQAIAVQDSRMSESEDSMIMGALVEWLDTEAEKPAKEIFDFRSFSMSSLFEPFGPLEKFKEDNWRYQIASRCLRSIGFERYLSYGRIKWRIAKGKGSVKSIKLKRKLLKAPN